jgi:precorrin-6Y C5,15-methyltransferase (decarboxylating)
LANRIAIIGIGDDGAAGLSTTCLHLIKEAEVLAGGDRHIRFFPDFQGETIQLQSGLADTVVHLGELRVGKRVVVLASGDPLYFGIASLMVKKLGREAVDIYPNVSSLQLAFTRMGDAWHDAVLESLHGRSIQGLAQRIDGKRKVALLTDHINTPAAIALYLLQFGMTEYEAFVAENLGSEDERCGFYSLEHMSAETFSNLNVVVLRYGKDSPYVPMAGFGFEDDAFHQRKPEKGLITKKEIRVLSLSELKLKRDSVVWDIGAGSGSVAVECARLSPYGNVFAIEKNEGDIENIEKNRITFRADITILHAKAPDKLDTLPDPDAVFIGGSGGELRDLIHLCVLRLKENGRIVINAATIETLAESQQALAQEGFSFRISLIQTARSKPILDMTRFEGLNPIYVITGFRASREE